MIKVSAPGNVFFCGEHAVVYGKPAIVASVGRRTRVLIRPRDDERIVVNSKEFGTASMERWGASAGELKKVGPGELMVLLDLIESLLDRAESKINESKTNESKANKGKTKGFEVLIESEIPVESGMSSSTAVFSTLVDSLNSYLELGIPRNEYYDVIIPFQRMVHGGKASGSEIFSSVFGGFHWLEREKGLKKTSGEMGVLKAKELGEFEVSVVIGDTRVRSPTKLTVGYHVPSLIERWPAIVEKAWDDIETIAFSARKAIKAKDIEALGFLMDENHAILRGLGLSHPKLEDCIAEARKAGALGAKLSGSGWGGIMFALCYKDDQDRVARAIARTGARVIKTSIGGPGLLREGMQ